MNKPLGFLVALLATASMAADHPDRRFVRIDDPLEDARFSPNQTIKVSGFVLDKTDAKERFEVRARLSQVLRGRLKVAQERTVKPRTPGHYILRVDLIDVTDEKRPSLARGAAFYEIVDHNQQPPPVAVLTP